MSVPAKFESFSEFWPYYLRQHLHPTCRRLHFVGTFLVISVIVAALVTQQWWLLWITPVCGYTFAWIGHFVFEKNKPATFTYPFYSLMADFVMFFKVLTGRLNLDLAKLK